jgi:hypothetical protein
MQVWSNKHESEDGWMKVRARTGERGQRLNKGVGCDNSSSGRAAAAAAAATTVETAAAAATTIVTVAATIKTVVIALAITMPPTSFLFLIVSLSEFQQQRPSHGILPPF